MSYLVIVADDEEDIRVSIARGISRWYDAEVFQVSEGDTLVEKVAQSGHISFILTDNDMPGGIKGVNAVAKIRALPNQHATPIYVMSANDVKAAALAAGATGFIDKRDMRNNGVRVTLEPILGQYLS